MRNFMVLTLTVLTSGAFAKNSNVGTSGGRFQLIQLSDMRRDQYMIDTQTGKIWTKVCVQFAGENCELDAWMQDNVVGISITETELARKAIELDKAKEEKKNKGSSK